MAQFLLLQNLREDLTFDTYPGFDWEGDRESLDGSLDTPDADSFD